MVLSWNPNLIADGQVLQAPGVDLAFGIFESDADTTDVMFIYTPDVCSLSVELFTEQVRHVLPNASPIGDIRLSVWTLDGPNTDTDLEVIVDGGPDEWVSWSIVYGQLPFVGAVVVQDEDVDGMSSVSRSAPSGPMLGCVASLDGFASPTVTYPGDEEHVAADYAHSGDTVEGDLHLFASDLAGPFGIASAVMRRVVFIGEAPADTWHVGGVGRSW